MKLDNALVILVFAIFLGGLTPLSAHWDGLKKSPRPNIVVIYFDDLGFGDVGFNGGSAIKTPNLDKLAAGGINFINGYATSATCTPSRYALLTGIYPWRNKDAKILPGTAPLIIDINQIIQMDLA
jgi:hypothetical protein